MKKRIKEETETKIFSAILIFLFLSITGILFYSNYGVSKKRQQLLAKISSLKQEIEILQTRNTDLKQGVTDIGDDVYWEQRIREELGYKKPGETMVVMINEEGEINEETIENKDDIWKSFIGEIRGLFE